MCLKVSLRQKNKSIKFSYQRLERATFRDKFPSLSVIQTGSKIGRSPNVPCNQRSIEWNEEQQEFARHKSIQTSHRALQSKRTVQRCPQSKLLKKLGPIKGEEYRDRLGDTFERKSAHSRQWRFVTHDGIIFSASQREEEAYSTVKQNSGFSDHQWHCGLRHTSEGLHRGAWRLSMDTFRQCYHWEDYAMNLVILIRDRQERRQYHPLNSRQPRESLSENKQWRTPRWICYNHLQKD